MHAFFVHNPSACRVSIGMIALWAFALATGCFQQEKPDPVVIAPPPPPPPPEPSLRVASDSQLTLFGEFPDQSRVRYEARAASSMKQHSFTSEGADYDVDISPDGGAIVFSSTRHSAQPDIYLKRVQGRAVSKLTDDPAGDVQPAISPDGRTIAFSSFRSGNWDLWIISLDGGQARQITSSPQHEVHPTWSPEGQRLAYCRFNEVAQHWELWTLQLDQPGSQRMIEIGLFPEWSPTGDSLVYQKARERGGRWFSIWRVDLAMGEPGYPVELASSAEMALIQPNWSPNGQFITYGTARLGQGGQPMAETDAIMTQGDIWVMGADGSTPKQLTDGAGTHFGPAWSPDGRVYFTSRITGSENIWSVLPVESGPMPMTSADNAAPGPVETEAIGAAEMPEKVGQGG